MSHQGRQPIECGPVSGASRTPRQSGAFGVEPRPSDLANQVSVGGPSLHGLMVPVRASATEGNRREKSVAIAGNSDDRPLPSRDLDLCAAASLALARCGISDKRAAGLMNMSPAQWSRQKNGVDGHHIQLDRLALLPDEFHIEFNRIYSALVGVHVAHARIANLLRARVIELLGEVNNLADQLEELTA